MFAHRTALLGALATGLFASAGLQAAEPLKAVGAGEGRLDIVAWPGYIERGETDKNYDWVTQFEKDSGCKVNVKTAATSDEMVSLMTKGGYDLVTASGDASLRLIYGKRVQPINPDLIPNWKTIDPRLQGGAWYTVDGKTYGTPYQWGPNLLMYNTKVFPSAPDSWSVVFDAQNLPDGKPNKGRVQAYDGPIYVADAALYLKTTQPDLGITDPYELNEKQYAAVLDLLRKQHGLIHRYWHDTTVQMSDFKNEGVAASSAWPYQANALKAEGQPIATVFPKEGATGWADTTMLHTDAKHPNCAYKWMDWSLQPKVQGDLAAWFGSVPAVPTGCKASELLGAAGCATNGYEQFDRIAFWKTPQAKCASQGTCVPYSRWTQDFIAIMGGR
ncbi:ABC transporter substrate-binding protein [Pseudomonas sp. UL073]|uniref:ABC transporter substrate-binding protein n=1 Tax=Zestomonas insulae TaxID=2809017 RepID=A0ABS2I9V0_9GAMM|nr:putative ABC transporter substrate-binding protein YdcS [Pseudomonas insulae]MBM7059911.1 ABC transporter substrate-binding protein [Pseudomonas insulae]